MKLDTALRLCEEKHYADFFEDVIKNMKHYNPQKTADFLLNFAFPLMDKENIWEKMNG
jgi:hypothetical protein